MGHLGRGRSSARSGSQPAGRMPPLRLNLIGGFSLERLGEPIHIPHASQRLVAYLALQQRPIPRPHVAGTLWPDATDRRAMGNLRSVVWRLRHSGSHAVAIVGSELDLAPGIVVDVRTLHELALHVLDRPTETILDDVDLLVHPGGLLPDWSDDWVLVERERLRQVRLHALEMVCGQLTATRQFGRAVDVCLAAVTEEPLRESAQRQLILVYLAEGNRIEVLRQYAAYRQLMSDELGLEPAREISDLVANIGIDDETTPARRHPKKPAAGGDRSRRPPAASEARN